MKGLITGLAITLSWTLLLVYPLASTADTTLRGTYLQTYLNYPAKPLGILRVRQDGFTDDRRYKVKKNKGTYGFYYLDRKNNKYSKKPSFKVKVDASTGDLQPVGDVSDVKYVISAKKVSDDPNAKFDLYLLGGGKSATEDECLNIGRGERPSSTPPLNAAVPFHSTTLAGCKALCPAMASWRASRGWPVRKCPSLYIEEIYNIDLLRVTTYTSEINDACVRGAKHKLLVEGQISPDSSFAVEALLDRLQPCQGADGSIVSPVSVSLSSGGGLLKDGYAMGRIFRKKGVTTIVENENLCASSCAVAYLGGINRKVEETAQLMYHAPYFSGENAYGERDVDCEVGDEALLELYRYYVEVTNAEAGDRLFERTMWYCSAKDGWVVTGGPAAELYGIATEK